MDFAKAGETQFSKSWRGEGHRASLNHKQLYTHTASAWAGPLASLAPMSSKDSLTISGTDLGDPDPASKWFNWLRSKDKIH